MKIGERGQVTIPKQIRELFRLTPATEVSFIVHDGEIVLRKAKQKIKKKRDKWVGFLAGKPENVDEYIEEVRGR